MDGTSFDESKKPKRNLTAYNFFFQSVRAKILTAAPIRPEGKPRRSHGKIGFAELARAVSSKWKSLNENERAIYVGLAAQDKIRYHQEMEAWNKKTISHEDNLPSRTTPIPAIEVQNCHPEVFMKKADTQHDTLGSLLNFEQSMDVLRSIHDPKPVSIDEVFDVGNDETLDQDVTDIFQDSAQAAMDTSMNHLWRGHSIREGCYWNNLQNLRSKLDKDSCEFLIDLFRS